MTGALSCSILSPGSTGCALSSTRCNHVRSPPDVLCPLTHPDACLCASVQVRQLLRPCVRCRPSWLFRFSPHSSTSPRLYSSTNRRLPGKRRLAGAGIAVLNRCRTPRGVVGCALLGVSAPSIPWRSELGEFTYSESRAVLSTDPQHPLQ
jgi:hypothetical protein